jgi:hypothetical protein
MATTPNPIVFGSKLAVGATLLFFGRRMPENRLSDPAKRHLGVSALIEGASPGAVIGFLALRRTADC